MENTTERRALGYVRLSREEAKSLSIEGQGKGILKTAPHAAIYTDNGVSGESNLSSTTGAWSRLWDAFQEDPSNTDVILWSYDRLGRKKGHVLYTTENILDAGGRIVIAQSGRVYESGDDAAQDIELTFLSYANEAYRKDVQRKTQRAITELQSAGAILGPPPRFTDAEVKRMKELRELGLGFHSIGKIFSRVPAKGGKPIPANYRTVRAALEPGYLTRDAWEQENQTAREKLRRG